jgi:hypothetical protein
MALSAIEGTLLLHYTSRSCSHSNQTKTENTERNDIYIYVLYGRGTWCLTPREEHKLRVFENRMLMRIFGPKREEVAGG